ncbi:hypothetical protein BO70DRAFT_327405 [Aspergillus heteromorphus CBS 117.55]|uniref:Zn(2)-C6 fungal-type domain-containing protein n=1 Tax=Aspergillus heteromorphus CBS 117.55 TaxID=1448321 RepID=A0A317X0Z4_9EURO|nr:uncharacterized protein BO70DRAFT_327405 [Aspergillus heteromorphus CBS 117.55]PWY92314.1 hypothetical protein BO70DRAFT_327405 [Aspergillus heteromorphus CBS 117.55]
MNATISAVKRRACVACTAAKAKCTPQAVNMCQRCARLGKSCTYLDLPQTKRKQRAAGAPGTDSGCSRVQVLEKKVDQLMAQLAALTGQNGQTPPDDTSAPASTSASNPPTNDLGLPRNPEPDSTAIAALLDAAKDPSHGLDPPTGSVLQGQPSIVDRGLLSAAEAERLVMTFRLDFVHNFPFVLLAHGETAARLRCQEPFLFLCIVAATMGSAHTLRHTVAEEIMKHVTLRAVVRSERNLELLRGLLVHSAWYSYPGERYHPRLLLLVQLCISMLYDLGLHRKAGLNADERRALLGTYWLSAGFYGTLGRPITLKHDARTDECIESLASTAQPSDRWIAPFIHLQSFLSTIDDVYASIHASGGMALVPVTRGSLQRQFDIVRKRVEKDLPGCPPSTANAVHTSIEFIAIRLEELSLRENLWTTDPANPVRTTMLMGMIQHSKELIHAITSLPASEIAQITIPTSAHICAAVGYMPSAVMTLLNIITTGSSDPVEAQVQVQAVVNEADYPALITALATSLETKFGGMSPADREMDIVGSLCSKMRLLARCYPYQVRAVVGVGFGVGTAVSRDLGQDTSMMGVDANVDRSAGTPLQAAWPSIYGDLDDMFPVEDIQWDALLSSFTGFG